MVRWLGLMVCIVGVVVAGDASAAGMSRQEVEKAFDGSVKCSRMVAAVMTDIERTRDVQSRGKKGGSSVRPSDIAGMTYLSKMLRHTKYCSGTYNKLMRSAVMQLIPDSWRRPGATVDRGKSALAALRVAATSLKTTKRMRLSGVKRTIGTMRKSVGDVLTSVNGMRRKALQTSDRNRQGGAPATGKPATRHFERLRKCSRRMAQLTAAMKVRRQQKYRGKASNYKVAPRQVVGGRNIDDIMKRGGWLQKCKAEHAKMTRSPMKDALPPIFLKPHHGNHARMKKALASILLHGAFLKSKGKHPLRRIDAMLKAFHRATGDVLSDANYAYRSAAGN